MSFTVRHGITEIQVTNPRQEDYDMAARQFRQAFEEEIQLTLTLVQKAIRDCKPGQKKVVLSTPIRLVIERTETISDPKLAGLP